MVRDLQTVNAEIAAAQDALKNVKGRTTEVYARIVGYYRSVRNWNKGKREEYNHRTMFEYKADGNCNYEQQDAGCAQTETTVRAANAGTAVRYEFFARKTCPNCPPVKSYIEELSMDGVTIDVDTDAGFAKASALGIFAAPTVIFYDSFGAEVFRAHSVPDMQFRIESATILA